jgi:hypothetical protein
MSLRGCFGCGQAELAQQQGRLVEQRMFFESEVARASAQQYFLARQAADPYHSFKIIGNTRGKPIFITFKAELQNEIDEWLKGVLE